MFSLKKRIKFLKVFLKRFFENNFKKLYKMRRFAAKKLENNAETKICRLRDQKNRKN